MTISSRRLAALTAIGLAGLLANAAHAATLEASYTFNNTLAATQSNVSALTAVDPEGESTFGTDTVFGQTRAVYNFAGINSPASDQSGLQVSSAGLIPSDNYSTEIVFKLNERDGTWRRIFDVQDRTSDNGFYVDPSNHLDIYPVAGSTTAFVTGQYYDVTLTNDGSTVDAYISGHLEFSLATSEMDVDSSNILSFFLDNLQGGGQGEWSSGSVALIKLYNGVLTADEVATNDLDPYTDVPTTPEPASLGVLGLGALAMLRRRR